MTDLDRRELLGGSAGLALALTLGGCETILRQIRNRPVRRDIAMLAPGDPMIAAYRDGVARMQALSREHPSDPRGWSQQVNIHSRFCPHSNWYFLPWHRAYLMSFEWIIRELTGVRDFALPYWNWTCQRAIPAPFWEPGSPLFHTNRAIGPTDEADPELIGPGNINTILAEPNYQLFASGRAARLDQRAPQGRLESGPHNYIHDSFVGGTMANIRTSPTDPIFWLHHNMLDYLWFVWNSRGHANPNHRDYARMIITDMVDGAGNPIEYPMSALVLAPLIGFRFAAAARCQRLSDVMLDEGALRRLLERGADAELRPQAVFPAVATQLLLDPRQQDRVRVPLPAAGVRAGLGRKSRQRLLLRVEDIRPPGDGSYVRVFVGLPQGEAPSPDSPHYAGAFAFFGGGHDGAGHDGVLDYHVDLTPAFDKLRASGRSIDPERTVVTFVPVRSRRAETDPAAAGPISIGAVVPLLIDREPLPATPR